MLELFSLPRGSTARSRRRCSPCDSGPPLIASTWVALSEKEPSSTAARRSIQVACGASSKPARNSTRYA
jgi:hypothetical protein